MVEHSMTMTLNHLLLSLALNLVEMVPTLERVQMMLNTQANSENQFPHW
jgi:hypothetical protein